jgi:hypothetical protein
MVAAAIPRPGRSKASPREVSQLMRLELDKAVYETVAKHCHFRGRVAGFQFVQQDDVLIVRGCVPSFYLKQVLQTVLMDVEGIRWIDNQVDVVSCCGLSSTRSP